MIYKNITSNQVKLFKQKIKRLNIISLSLISFPFFLAPLMMQFEELIPKGTFENFIGILIISVISTGFVVGYYVLFLRCIRCNKRFFIAHFLAPSWIFRRKCAHCGLSIKKTI